MSLEQRLRDAVQKLRRTPMPISDIAPLLQEAADEIDRLKNESLDNQMLRYQSAQRVNY